MKKFFVTLICIIYCSQLVSFANQDSYNSFLIPLKSIPEGDTQQNSSHKSSSNGLSGGAVTAITLGSIFGGLAAGGAALYFYKKGIHLVGCCVRDKNNALVPIFFKEKIRENAIKNNNKYLIKILKNECISNDKKYLFIGDNFIKEKSYNRIYFKVENNFSKVKIMQYSEPFELSKKVPKLDTKIYDEESEIPLLATKIDSKNGILIKNGEYKFIKNNYYYFDTFLTENKSKNIYAVVIEFE